jgi:D-alanine-D-alanine ligase
MDGMLMSPFTSVRATATNKRIAVLMGGWSCERPVSLTSGAACADALEAKEFRVDRIDVTEDLPALIAKLTPAPDAVFNALHGKGGEDGTIQAILDMMRIPYTHSGRLASATAMDKPLAKLTFAAAGLRCAPGRLVSRDEMLAGDPMARPYVVKPPAEGSSMGVRIVHPQDNQIAFDESDWPFGNQVLVEKFIPGRELTVGVAEIDGVPHAFGVTEIRPLGKFFDYTSKYTAHQAEHLVPAPIHAAAYAEAMRIAERAHRALGCRGVSRADLRYDDTAGEPGQLYLLEVNTQPGMTPLSLVPEQAAARGISFGDLVAWMVDHAAFGG